MKTDGTVMPVTWTSRRVVLVSRSRPPCRGRRTASIFYYLNVMGGPVRQWRFSLIPNQAHLPH